jgi:hypothetical protein
MSWLFSQALAEAFSAGTCSDGEPCAQLNVMPTPHPFWLRDRTMEAWRPSQFGLTCAALTAHRGAELLTWFRAGFPVRTSALPDAATVSTANAPASGWKWPASFAKCDPGASLWRTRQCSLVEDSPVFSQTWPAWGSLRDGECLEHTTPALAMSEKGCGFWPTPTKRDSRTLAGSQPPKRAPTSGLPLAWTIALTLTPEQRSGGRLNPTWVEWLMGWPRGWTDLRPLGTARFREWQLQHGICSADVERKAA